MTTIQDLAFAYRKKSDLFAELSLDLPEGNIYGLLGKNGAGKTTLLKIISGLLFPKEGSCRIDGLEARNRSPELLSEIYFIAEEFVLPPVSMNTYRKLFASFYPRFNNELFNKAVLEFELDEGTRLNSMSYGQMKKFLIAFGLATDCRLLILDEPTNGLDIPSKSQFRKLLAATLSEERTFLISTHQVRDMQNLIDPIIILDEGKIIFQADSIDVSRCLSVNHQQQEPGNEALYWESVPTGYMVVQENKNGAEAQIDLELLFNTVITQKERVTDIFAGKGGKA